ncbi:50S ribosomal protein L19e [Candidatus Bathyarchaeota archaeon RBG_16_57_9]|jgi:large subunit ribosomal protein L19e|nr:MAG: 50S ribosomal protein L19e [Candidatus Bathyarchaeota archaeon RBG_16_57_9]OGD54107.1 MAG: 50S ribosomal protein L19e [Candidatus Bathyarchaeota archaeon RBG_13_60_20]
MNLRSQRRLAAEVLGCGANRVWIDPEKSDDVSMAITREEIRKLVHEKAIKALPENSHSRGRTRVLAEKKKKGRRIGPGTKKGKINSVVPRKTRWMNRIRAQRRKLRELRERRIIAVNTYRRLYRKAKGGEFRSIAEMERFINDRNLRRRTFG